MINSIVHSSSMGKVCTQHILRLLWRRVEIMFFRDSEHARRNREMLPHPKKTPASIEWGNKFRLRDSPNSPQEYPWNPVHKKGYFFCFLVFLNKLFLQKSCTTPTLKSLLKKLLTMHFWVVDVLRQFAWKKKAPLKPLVGPSRSRLQRCDSNRLERSKRS